MPTYHLWADFNQSRRINRNQAERDAAALDPGAIVAANLNRDDRTLPASVAAGAEIALDATLAAKSARDQGPVAVLLGAERGAGQHHLAVSIASLFMRGIKLLDSHKNVMRTTLFTRYDLGAQQNDVDLFVEVGTLAGSPLRGFPTLTPSRTEIHRTPPPLDERRFTLTMEARPLAGGALTSESGTFTIAPWLMVDESAPLLRLYMVKTDNNYPSVQDIYRALPDPSKLTIVPNEVAAEDTWLQDQYELGCFHTPNGVTLCLLHMPRLRRNYTGRGATTGLPNFVRAHFPSRTVGVFDEFWQRTLPLVDMTGNRVDLSFELSAKVREALVRPFLFRSHLLMIANAVLTKNPIRDPITDKLLETPREVKLLQAITDINTWAPLVLAALTTEAAAAADASLRALLTAYRADVISRRTSVNNAVSVMDGGISITAIDPPAPGTTTPTVVWSATIPASTADILEKRVSQMHASQNYGGNLQLGPPTSNAPYGHMFIGNHVDGQEGLVDTELLNFLDKQRIQPLHQIDTSWLAVAHVDEILSFVPRRRGGGTHAIWLNSTKLALDIMRASMTQYMAGLPRTDIESLRPSAVNSRHLNLGISPITAMFRGKKWHHSHLPNAVETQEPPQLYIAMAEFYHRSPYSAHNIGWTPGPGPDRNYPAKMTVRELLFFESRYRIPDPNFAEPEAGSTTDTPPQLTTNAYIEQEKLGYLRAQLSDIYPEVGLVIVPTIYDVVREPNSATGAYTPNAANIVIADSRLLIPKPFGPRVKPVDAVAIITAAFTENGLENLLSGFNERWLRSASNLLLGVKQWFHAEDLQAFGGGSHLSTIADEFKDGLIGMTESERQQVILRSNRSHFRSDNLRDGWHELTIPEDTVDLFEVAIALAAKSIGMEWRFVDSWSYHITFGEIHCGTNALRTPSFSGITPWWEHYFRAPPSGT